MGHSPSGRSARGLNHASRDLLAIPVVDAANQLAGVVTVDDVIDVIRDEATEDILKLAGTTAEEIHFPGVLRGAWIRFPWLVPLHIVRLPRAVQISAVAHDHGECHESDGKSAAKSGTKRGTRRH